MGCTPIHLKYNVALMYLKESFAIRLMKLRIMLFRFAIVER
jgi:hypothetical protein